MPSNTHDGRAADGDPPPEPPGQQEAGSGAGQDTDVGGPVQQTVDNQAGGDGAG